MSHSHIVEIDHAPKRKGGKLQYIYRIVEVRSKNIISAGQQYSRKADAVKTAVNAFGPLIESGKFILADLIEMKKSKLKNSGPKPKKK